MSFDETESPAGEVVGSIRYPLATWISLSVLVVLSLWVGSEYGWNRGLLVVVGGLLGITLYYSSFGFSAAWRLFVFERRGTGVQAQLVMLALAVTLFFPLLAAGEIFGQTLQGSIAPVGSMVAIGAFLFGIGMQLGGGCASGTLFSVGGGDSRTLLTLLSFITGATVLTFHLPWWKSMPSLGPVSLVDHFGWFASLVINLAVMSALYFVVAKYSKEEPRSLSRREEPRHWIRGPWPLLWGAIALALLNTVVLLLSGRPWGITGAFSLWGGHAMHAVGFDLQSSPFWSDHDFSRSLLSDVPTTTSIGIILGALVAAGLRENFNPTLRLNRRSVATAIVGGLMMGYGGRLAFGCNIGALFSGIASGSLHGWLWLMCGFAGSIIGVYVRRWMGDGPYKDHSIRALGQGSD